MVVWITSHRRWKHHVDRSSFCPSSFEYQDGSSDLVVKQFFIETLHMPDCWLVLLILACLPLQTVVGYHLYYWRQNRLGATCVTCVSHVANILLGFWEFRGDMEFVLRRKWFVTQIISTCVTLYGPRLTRMNRPHLQKSDVLLCRDKLAKMAKDNRNRAGISLRLIRQPHMGLVI